MIPKKIHYCWFGGKPKPESFQICLESWEKYLPDYEITEWNESNFDLNCCGYVKLAAAQNQWAFVSDYARALAFGCKISIDSPKIEKTKEDFLNNKEWLERKEVVERMFSEDTINEKNEFFKDFYVHPKDAVENKELGLWLIGADNKISPDEMKKLFGDGYLQKMFRFLKSLFQKK